MDIELKIKQVSLGDEAAYIKFCEEKLHAQANKCYGKAQEANDPEVKKKYTNYALRHVWKAQELKDHRKGIVALEARAANLARAFIKGKSYSYAESEGWVRKAPPISRVARLVQKYSNGKYAQNSKILADLESVIMGWVNT